MGRPRKQPRRIMTFNLNQPLAKAIDELPVKNRSEWANKVLQEVLDGRVEDKAEAREEAILNARYDETRLISEDPVAALSLAIRALNKANLDLAIVYGKIPVEEHMSLLRTALISNMTIRGVPDGQ